MQRCTVCVTGRSGIDPISSEGPVSILILLIKQMNQIAKSEWKFSNPKYFFFIRLIIKSNPAQILDKVHGWKVNTVKLVLCRGWQYNYTVLLLLLSAGSSGNRAWISQNLSHTTVQRQTRRAWEAPGSSETYTENYRTSPKPQPPILTNWNSTNCTDFIRDWCLQQYL